MGRVYVAVQVNFDGCIDRNDTEAAYYFRAVWDFRRTENQFVAEEIHIVVDAFQTVICNSQWTGATEFDASFANQSDHGILDYLCVHFECRNRFITSQCTEYSVGDVSYTRLQRQETGRDNTAFHVGCKEVGNILADFVGQRISGSERTRFVRPVGFHYAYNLFRVYLNVRQSDTVTRFIDRYFAAVRRVERFVYVVHTHTGFAVCAVQLHDDLVGKTADGRGDAAGGSQINFSVWSYFAGFDDGYVHFAHEPVAHFLCHLWEVYVVVGNLSVVHSFAEVGVGSIRSAVADGFGAWQYAVTGFPCRCACENSYLKRVSFRMFCFSNFCEFGCYSLGRSGGSKSA